MLKNEITEKEAKELDLVEIWFDGCIKVDEGINFRIKSCNYRSLYGYKLKTDNARFFVNYYDEDCDDIYVVCPRKYVEEGKKLFAKGYASYYLERQISELKEKMDSLKEEQQRWEEKYNSMPDMDESKFAVFCTVRYDDAKGWQISEKEVCRADGYKKDVRVEETLSRREHFVNKAFAIKTVKSEVVGKCWKEDLDACKRMVLDRRISLIKQQKDEYTKKVDVGDVLADRFKDMLDEID